jgi:glycosyltransferase involved in cell wall biosynthesis
MEFRLVGPVLPECQPFVQQAGKLARIDKAVPETSLPEVYAWGDVFVLPTIEDGFAVVLAQAQAAGLPIITTSHSGGPDIIAGGGKGFVVPIRAPERIVERLLWCDDNREQLAEMAESLQVNPPQRGWHDVASDFLKAVTV